MQPKIFLHPCGGQNVYIYVASSEWVTFLLPCILLPWLLLPWWPTWLISTCCHGDCYHRDCYRGDWPDGRVSAPVARPRPPVQWCVHRGRPPSRPPSPAGLMYPPAPRQHTESGVIVVSFSLYKNGSWILAKGVQPRLIVLFHVFAGSIYSLGAPF